MFAFVFFFTTFELNEITVRLAEIINKRPGVYSRKYGMLYVTWALYV